MPQDNTPTSFRPTPEARRQLDELAQSQQYGDRTQVLVTALDRLYQQWLQAGRPHKAQPRDGAELAALLKGKK